MNGRKYDGGIGWAGSMTNPEADFGDALRRALSGAAEVTPTDGDALRRIRARANSHTPRRRLQAALALVIPWPAFRLLQYRTLVGDLLRDGAATARVWLTAAGQWLVVRGGQLAAVSVRLTASGRGWLTGRGLPALVHAWSAARSATSARGKPVVARVWSTVRGWTSRFAAAAASGRASGSGAASAEGAHAPRHADSAPPLSNIGWLRPALAAAAVAFVATLAVTVGPVRQAIVQLGSSVISDGHTQGGNGGGSLNGTGHHTSLVPAPTSAVTVATGSPRPSAKPSATVRSSCGASASASATPSSPCAESSATAPPVVATTPPASTSPSVSPSPSASASASPSASPTPTNSGQAVTAPTNAAASAP